MKECSRCHLQKENTEFYKDSRGKLGTYAACKKCHNKFVIKVKGQKYIIKNRRLQNRYRFNPKNKYKIEARIMARKAKELGIIPFSSCKICGDSRFELHHPDHKKPLDVIPLCKKHHMQEHYKSL